MEPAYVGIGTNVGDPIERIDRARVGLRMIPGVERVALSSLWRSAPVGPVPDQPWFVNACAALYFASAPPGPRALLAALLDIEARAGRDRRVETPQGPRALDLDLLVWGAQIVDDPGPPPVRLPHPRLHERAFALAPLVELAGPELLIPGRGRAGDLLARALADPRQAVAKIV